MLENIYLNNVNDNIIKKGGFCMNKLNKIFLGIIIILMVLLSFVTVKYLKLKNQVYEYLGNYDFTYYNEDSGENK